MKTILLLEEEDCESYRKKDRKEGFDGGCHRASRYKLPPLLPPTKCLELEKAHANEK